MAIELIQLKIELARRLPELSLSENRPLSGLTTFRIGGPCRILAQPAGTAEAAELLHIVRAHDVKYALIGNGSNLLAPDDGYDGIIIRTAAGLRGIRVEEGRFICAQAGVSLSAAAALAADRGLTGMEFAFGIPGTVGGALYMNAGAYGSDMAGIAEETTACADDGSIEHIRGKDHAFGYRQSLFKSRRGLCVLETRLRLEPGNPQDIREQMRAYTVKRQISQPLEMPSAGSVFKRPPGHYAGGLIEQCGLKGMTVGKAQVSEKHAGFIVNLGGATCADVLTLIDKIKDAVYKNTGVELECEIELLK